MEHASLLRGMSMATSLVAWWLLQSTVIVHCQTVTQISPQALKTVRTAATTITLTGSTAGDTADFAAAGTCGASPLYTVSGTTIKIPGGSFSVTIAQGSWTNTPGSAASGQYFGFSQSDGDTVFGTTTWGPSSGAVYTIAQTGSQSQTVSVRLWRANSDCNNAPCGRLETGSAGSDWALSDVATFAGPTTTAGTYKLCYKAAAGSTVQQSGIDLVASVSTPFALSAISPTTVTAGTPTTLAFTTVATALNDKIEFSQTACSGNLAASGTATTLGNSFTHSVSFTLSVTGTWYLCYVKSGNSDSVTQYFSSSFARIEVTAATPIAGADPIASFGDTVREFDLPPRTLVNLLQAPDIMVSGSVFEAEQSTKQWFGRIIIATPDHERWAEVIIRDDLEQVNASKEPSQAFWTLNVTIGSKHEGFYSTIPGHDAQIPKDFLGYELTFRTMPRHSSLRFASIGRLPRECIDMAGPSLHFYICSAPADEYYGEFRHLSLRYAHLDLGVVEVWNMAELTGVLPELWGLQPMSEQTRSYVTKESVPKTAAVESFKTIPSVGGPIQISEEVERGCHESNHNGTFG